MNALPVRRLVAVLASALATTALVLVAPAAQAAEFDYFGEEFYLGPLEVGDTVELDWGITDATTVTASGDWSGAKPATGTEDVTLVEGINVFTLTADEGQPGEAVATVRLVAGVDIEVEAGECSTIVATNTSDVTIRFLYAAIEEEFFAEPDRPVLEPGETSEALPFPYDLDDETPIYRFEVLDEDSGEFVPAFADSDGLDYPVVTDMQPACNGGNGSSFPTVAPAAGHVD